jgi:hypothetical protein
MNRFLCTLAAAATSLAAQTTTVFPADYRDVAEGPNNSPNLPFANGAGRTMLFYDQRDLALPAGATITRLGFRQDQTLTSLDQGRTLQLEVRMGYTDANPIAPNTTFDANWSSPPVTVFGPALFALPNLRDPNQPLPNGQLFLDLATPFVHQPNGRHLVVEYRVLGNSAGGASFNYRLDRADFFSPVRSGPAGCRHSGGQRPTLSVTPTRTGGTVTATLASAPANSFLMLGIQLGELATPYSLGSLIPGIDASCTGQIALGSLAAKPGASNTSGGATLTYTIPNDLLFRGLYLSHQAACFDFFAPGGMVVSNGAELRLGQRPMASSLSAQGPVTVATGTANAHYCPVAFFVWQ